MKFETCSEDKKLICKRSVCVDSSSSLLYVITPFRSNGIKLHVSIAIVDFNLVNLLKDFTERRHFGGTPLNFTLNPFKLRQQF